MMVGMSLGVLHEDDPVFELGQGNVAYPLYDEFDRTVSSALGQLNAAAWHLVALTRRAIAEGWWQKAGCVDPEHWLRSRCGLEAGHARRIATMARELGDYPTVAAELAAGRITEDHAYAVITCVDPAHEQGVATSVTAWTVAQVRRFSANYPKPRPEPEPDGRDDDADDGPSKEREPVDVLRFGWDDRGRFTGDFDLGAEAGSVLEKALAAARGRVFTERSGVDVDDEDLDDDRTSGLARTSWADALERLAHAGLAGLDPKTAAGQRPSDRYQVLLHVDLDRLSGSRIHLGPTLTTAQRQQLTCDADVRTVLWEGGRPVGLGRRRRAPDGPLRALIEDRDRGCRHCGARGFLHIHHLVHWEPDGPTDPDNLIALCTRCHRDIHAGRLRATGDPTRPDGLTFLDARGRPLPTPATSPPTGDPPPHLARAKPYSGPHRGRRMPRGIYRN
jgi:Domain of unknown function (DUF222)/HNH endonuclease